jgi:hypothetical protein
MVQCYPQLEYQVYTAGAVSMYIQATRLPGVRSGSAEDSDLCMGIS